MDHTQLIIDKIDTLGESLGERIAEVREDLREFRGEVQDTYARESDCVTRMAHEQEFRSESLKRVWAKLDEHSDSFDIIRAKVSSLETARQETKAVEQVKSSAWKWLLGVLAALITATYAAWLKGWL